MGRCDRRRWVGGVTRYGSMASYSGILNIIVPRQEEDREDGSEGVLMMRQTWHGYPLSTMTLTERYFAAYSSVEFCND